MLRLGCFSKIGFSLISTTIPAAGQILLNRKYCESQQNSINSIIEEIKKGISKLESEMERSIVTEKDEKFDPSTLEQSSVPVQRKNAENDDKKPAKLAVDFAKMFSSHKKIKMLRRYTMEYSILDEPNHQQKIEIALKQDGGGTKLIQISQDIEASTDIESCWVIGVQIILPLPKDASLLLNAMDALEDEWKENYAKALRQNQPSMICQQLVKGMIARYKLGIHFHPNKPLDFQMETLAKDDGVLWKLRGPIPIDVFYWLKAQMAELLDEYNDKFKDDEKKDKDETKC